MRKIRRRCRCGCGETTNIGRMYIWGHKVEGFGSKNQLSESMLKKDTGVR